MVFHDHGMLHSQNRRKTNPAYLPKPRFERVNNFLAEFGVINRGDSPGIQIDMLLVRHDTLFITWHAESKHHLFGFGTDTFVFKGDKVERQSISFPPPQPR